MGHGYHIYEEGVLVPLLFCWPDRIPPGQVITSPVELVDIMPTILELIHFLPDHGAFQGRSLAGALLGKSPLPADRRVFLHRRHYNARRAETDPEFERYKPYRPGSEDVFVKGTKYGIRHDRWKFIQGGEEGSDELFDLEQDPRELQNVAADFPAALESLRSALVTLQQTYRLKRQVGELPRIAEEDAARLKTMGYIE